MQPHFAQLLYRYRDNPLLALPIIQQRFQRGLSETVIIGQPLRTENTQTAGAVFKHDGFGCLLCEQVALVVPVRHHPLRQVVHPLKITPLDYHHLA